MHRPERHRGPRRRPSRTHLALIGFLAIAGALLLTEHRAHTIEALPWALLGVCLVLHFLGHGGHGGHGGGRD